MTSAIPNAVISVTHTIPKNGPATLRTRKDQKRDVDLPVVLSAVLVPLLDLLAVALVQLLVLGHVGLLRNVEQREQEDPNQVDKMPIDADELHSLELPTPPRVHRDKPHDDRSRDHVEPV